MKARFLPEGAQLRLAAASRVWCGERPEPVDIQPVDLSVAEGFIDALKKEGTLKHEGGFK